MRGATQVSQWYDEISFMQYNDIVHAAAAPANMEACREAVISKKPHGKLFTTTAGDLRYQHGTWCRQFFNNMATFTEDFYSMTKNEVEEYIKKKSRNACVYIEYSYKELGRSEQYYLEQCQALNWDRQRILREVLNVWCNSSDTSPFTAEQIEILQRKTKPATSHIILQNMYELNLYSDFIWTDPIAIGVDVAAGSSLDNSAVTLVDYHTFRVIGVMKSNTIDPLELGDVLIELMYKYLPNSVLFIERNNNGVDTITYMLKKKPGLKERIYGEMRTKTEEVTKKDIRDPKVKYKQKVRKFEYGISTNTATRPQMIDLLFNIIKHEPEVFVSMDIIHDIEGLERSKTGKVEHSSVTHDDCLFSYLMVRWTWTYGNNIQSYYVGQKAKNYTEAKYDDEDEKTYIANLHTISRMNMPDTLQNNTIKFYSNMQKELNAVNKPSTQKNNMMNFIMNLNKK